MRVSRRQQHLIRAKIKFATRPASKRLQKFAIEREDIEIGAEQSLILIFQIKALCENRIQHPDRRLNAGRKTREIDSAIRCDVDLRTADVHCRAARFSWTFANAVTMSS